jgi:hypothetical protein
MKELSIFRIFAFFPLIGIVIPDIATGLHLTFSVISTEHIIVDITLSVCVLICSLGIWLAEIKDLKTA